MLQSKALQKKVDELERLAVEIVERHWIWIVVIAWLLVSGWFMIEKWTDIRFALAFPFSEQFFSLGLSRQSNRSSDRRNSTFL